MPPLDDLRLFFTVAREKSFTKAAAVLGLRQSSVSRSIRLLEERLGIRLLARTTRSVSLTEAGEALIAEISPLVDAIDAHISSFSDPATGPSGHLRITTAKHAYDTVLRPVLPRVLKENPRVTIEIVIDDALTDIVAGRFDAGIRFGGMVDKDMIARRIWPDVPAAIVASPAYLAARGVPTKPDELTHHLCINYREASSGGLYRWWFQKGNRSLNVRVEGSVILNDGDAIVSAAVDGLGIGYTFQDKVDEHLRSGRLVSLLEDWRPTFPGYHLYYTSKRQTRAALTVLSSALIKQLNGA
jgi:DNA-binding transcriptional LysR family regulator